MELFLWIAGPIGAYGFGWFVSMHAMAKTFISPKRTALIKEKSYYGGTSYELVMHPQPEVLSEKEAKKKVKLAYDRAASTAWVWPIAWPVHLLLLHFGKARYRGEENFTKQMLEVKRSAILVSIVRAELDNHPIMLKAASASSESELRNVEIELKDIQDSPAMYALTGSKGSLIKHRLLKSIGRS